MPQLIDRYLHTNGLRLPDHHDDQVYICTHTFSFVLPIDNEGNHTFS